MSRVSRDSRAARLARALALPSCLGVAGAGGCTPAPCPLSCLHSPQHGMRPRAGVDTSPHKNSIDRDSQAITVRQAHAVQFDIRHHPIRHLYIERGAGTRTRAHKGGGKEGGQAAVSQKRIAVFGAMSCGTRRRQGHSAHAPLAQSRALSDAAFSSVPHATGPMTATL